MTQIKPGSMFPDGCGSTWHTDAARSRSVVHVRAQQPPLQLVRSFALPNGAVLAHVHNVGGGVLGGDRLDSCPT